MLFNSTNFLIFFFIYLIFYFAFGRKSIKKRNFIIALSSYTFYSFWDWRFTFLLLFSSVVDFYIANLIESKADNKKRKTLLCYSIISNIGILFVFKYFGFFCESFNNLLNSFGIKNIMPYTNFILPVGISFYTFQSLGYTIDVYRRKVKPVKELIPFLAYVSFFPQLVAGPIERCSNLMPQFLTRRSISNENIFFGLTLISFGLFKKVVIADNLAPLVDMVYSDAGFVGPVIILATFAFGIQIYCDFSGYSDIARGLAAILGFKLMLNFNLPYFACSPKDFWRRWHISLSTWFRDYIYIPLGGNQRGLKRTILNLFLTMAIAGLWHGAGWNFILWGLWHGLILSVFSSFLPKKNYSKFIGWFLTMIFVFYGWLLFRAVSLEQIVNYTINIFNNEYPIWFSAYVYNLLIFTLPFILIQFHKKYLGEPKYNNKQNTFLNLSICAFKIYFILMFWSSDGTQFIYFQF